MSNTLTPPREDSGLDDDFPILDNGVVFNTEGHQPSLQLNSSLPTPVSHMDMSLDFDEGRKSGMDARNESHEMTYDEDQDMSDGGVPLTTSSPHNEHDNGSDSSDEELDTIDSEMMGTQNLQGLLHSANLLQSTLNPHDAPPHYSPHIEPYFPEEYAEYAAPEEAEPPSAFAQPPPTLSNLPEAMSQISQQLQHIQDGQAHGELNGLEEPQAHLHLENSTAPLPLPSLSYVSMGDSEEPPSHISMSDVSAVAAGSINVPHMSGTEDWTSSLAVDTMYLGHDYAGSFPFSSLQAAGGDDASEADENEVDEQINLSLPDFLHRWGMTVSTNGSSKKLPRGPDLASVREQSMKMLQTIDISDLNGEQCDIQGINWDNLGVSRSEARQMRRQTYRNYTNLRMPQQEHTRRYGTRLDNLDNHFKFRRMDFEHDVHLAHFQLRNLLACPSRGNTFYAGHSQVMRVNQAGDKSVAMDLTDPDVQPLHAFSNGIQISTLTAAHDVLVAGGFCGEYGLSNLRAEQSTKHTEGLITDHHNSITNHIQVHLSRGSSAPLAAFASNDNGLRILDVTTNKLIKEQKFEYAINCSSISPDQRLRVLVGDTKSVMICNAETGEILQDLKEPNGHLDFGFACDWADDGWTVATGNQDMQIKIWDARKWTTNRGIPLPLATIAAEMAGVRKLKFSPLGSGKRVLVAAEPADFISVIDAETFNAKQTLSFFGEIGGVDFTNNGQDLIIANCDSMRGGIMEFKRCDFAAEALYGLSGSSRRTPGSEKDFGLDWRSTEEKILWHPQAKRTATHRKRKAVNLSAMGAF